MIKFAIAIGYKISNDLRSITHSFIPLKLLYNSASSKSVEKLGDGLN